MASRALRWALPVLALAAQCASRPDDRSIESRDDATADIIWDDSKVLGIRKIVHAGEPTMIYTNMARSKLAEEGYQKLEIYLNAQSETMDYFFPDVYCLLVPCVWSNVTSFNVTIPKDAFPASADMKIWSELFDSSQEDSDPRDFGHPDNGVRFNLTGGTGAWSDYEVKNGWSVFGSDAYQMPCSMIACARKCMKENLDASKSGLSQTYNKGLQNCTEACGSWIPDLTKRTNCITANVTEAQVPAPTSSSAPASTSGASPSSSSGAKGDGKSSAPGRGRPGEAALTVAVLGWAAAWIAQAVRW